MAISSVNFQKAKSKQEKKLNEEYKNYKLEAGEKALSKSEWLAQKTKS